MDYRYKDTIAVPREYAITRNWLYKVKDQTIFVLGQEFLMSTLYWIACHVDMKILRPSMNNVHTLPRKVKYRNLSDMWRSTLKIGAARYSLLLYRIRSLYITVLMREQKPYPIWLSCRHKSYLVYCRPPCQQRFFACSILMYSERVDFQCRVIFTCIKFTFANKI